ncbi:MAG TPA: hypothetical protein VJ719_03925 [Chthoniobacterales bacterium]|nr:hypothetical protein [Chthoniobacterales bacterium]
MPVRFFLLAFLHLALIPFSGSAQTAPNEPDQPVRVNVTMNPDGTRTAYQFDQAHRQATATTTDAQGKVTQKIKYQIDEAGRFSSGIVMGPNDKFLYKSVYKYTPEGRLGEETHLNKDETVANRLVYSYDANGRQTGYVVYDASGKVIARTSPVQSKSASPKPERKKR